MFYDVSLTLTDLDVPTKIFDNLTGGIVENWGEVNHPGAAIIFLTVIKNVAAFSEAAALQKVRKQMENERGMSEFLIISSQRGFQPQFIDPRVRKISM